MFEIYLLQTPAITCVKTNSDVYYLCYNKLQDVFLLRIFNMCIKVLYYHCKTQIWVTHSVAVSQLGYGYASIQQHA